MDETGKKFGKLQPRETGDFVAKRAENLHIIEAGIDKLADEILKAALDGQLTIDRFTQSGLHPKPDDPQRAVDWLFLCDSLNFCFWSNKDQEAKWTVNGETGYFALCAALNRAIDEGFDILKPEFYSHITDEQAAHIFRGDKVPVTNENDEQEMVSLKMPLLAERVRGLHAVGKVLIHNYNGTFLNCLRAANHSAKKLLETIVREFPTFKDEAQYKGNIVCFYKRAQILIGDIWACFKGQGDGHFDDIDHLTMFADYRVPQVLIHYGALKYHEDFASILSTGMTVARGEAHEVEIRGASIYIVEQVRIRVLDRIAKDHPDKRDKLCINSVLIDHYLWDYRRQHATELEDVPFHRTTTIFY